MSLDQLFITFLIALVVFINVVLPMFRRAAQEAQQDEGAEDAEPIVPAASVRKRVIPVGKGRTRPSQDRHHRPLPVSVIAQRQDVRPVMLREARRGMVLMAVLGPCRGVERLALPGE
ncbi:MAG: hypothetical protein Q7U39_00955 [Nitrospira sp.]|nr:hypothetical protein [Nitrospira sp.]